MQSSPRPVARKVRRTTVLNAEPGVLPWARRTSTLVVMWPRETRGCVSGCGSHTVLDVQLSSLSLYACLNKSLQEILNVFGKERTYC